jgi:hypothetical protein
MPARPGSKNWNDLKMLMAALTVATTLGLWNVFAQIDKQNTAQEVIELQESAPADVDNNAQPAFYGKILLGGQAPNQQVITVRTRSNRSGNAQQPAPVTQTRSS